MSRIAPLDEANATGLAKEVFDEFKRIRNVDAVPAFWRVMARDPEYLKVTWERYKHIMLGGSLPLLTKEIIALAVSAAHTCDYCVGSHTAAVQKLGLTDEQVLEIMEVVDFFSGTNGFASGNRIYWED